MNNVDMKTLKVSQKVHIRMNSQVYEATVVEMNGPSHGWESFGGPSILVEKYVRVEIAPSVTKWLPRGSGQNAKLKLKEEKWEKLEWVPTAEGGFWKPVPLLADDLANYNRPETENGCAIDFNYDGSQICSWEAGGVWEPRLIADLEIIKICD